MINNQLQEYIMSALSAIKAGLADSGFKLKEEINFDVAVVNTANGFELYLPSVKNKIKFEEINYIKFSIEMEGE